MRPNLPLSSFLISTRPSWLSSRTKERKLVNSKIKCWEMFFFNPISILQIFRIRGYEVCEPIETVLCRDYKQWLVLKRGQEGWEEVYNLQRSKDFLLLGCLSSDRRRVEIRLLGFTRKPQSRFDLKVRLNVLIDVSIFHSLVFLTNICFCLCLYYREFQVKLTGSNLNKSSWSNIDRQIKTML